MSTNRRDFIKTIGATSVALASSDLVASLVAQSPKGRVLESKFKGLSDIALERSEAPRRDVLRRRASRATSVTRSPSATASSAVAASGAAAAVVAASAAAAAATRAPASAIRVLHSGVWGFASSPHGHRGTGPRDHAAGRRGRPGERHRQALRRQADADAGVSDLLGDADQGRPVRRCRSTTGSRSCSAINEQLAKTKGIIRTQSSIAQDYEWKYFASSEGSYIEQESWRMAPSFTAIGARGQRQGEVAHLHRPGPHRRLRGGDRRRDDGERRPHRRRGRRALDGAVGVCRAEGHHHDARRTRC